MKQAIQDIREASDDLAKDLYGYATRAAITELTSNWSDAVADGDVQFNLQAAASDIDFVIEKLTKLKLRLTDDPAANQTMRQALGI